MAVKRRDYERLDDVTVSKVIKLLEAEKPITKKTACEILHISYSTKRLANIIQEYIDNAEYASKKRKEKRGKKVSEYETQEIVVSYLQGVSMAVIAKRLFRPTYLIKKVLEQNKVPLSTSSATYQKPDLLPDDSISETYKVGEYAWSARYGCVCEIQNVMLKVFEVYRIWVFGKHNQYAYQPYWELGKLDILEQFNLRGDEFQLTNQSLELRIQ